MLVDQAGWHVSQRFVVLGNITIVPLPAKCPELSPVENVWQFLRDNWLAGARACGIGPVETFAVGLEVDGAAVRAALTESWSSGQAKGKVNRLKLLKRQSYGRASFDLLRRRVLMAA